MVLIYTTESSNRLQYICQVIFKEQLGLTYSLTLDAEGFGTHEGPKINYSSTNFETAGFQLHPHSILFESEVCEQQIDLFTIDEKIAFFKTTNSDFSFDVFAASFYLLSRYEEYLPFTPDEFGRYPHTASLAFKAGFLQQPLINLWLNDFVRSLKNKFPELEPKLPVFNFTPTYDIDIAYSYKSKGLLRNLGGFVKSPSVKRFQVMLRLQKDPYDVYDYLNALHEKNKQHPIYFFLVATSLGRYDKNLSPYSHAMWHLMRQHAKKYTVGLHPSWKSFGKISVILKEKKIIESAAKIIVQNSRQHYIKFELPTTFNELIDAGITHDYSMGYGTTNGFRASIAHSFLWYDLKAEKRTNLRVHPFCFMDANSFFQQKQNVAEAFEELNRYAEICKNVNGHFISIFHNNILGDDEIFDGWKEMYSKFINQLQQ